jgi:hypothetical protein
MDVHTIASEVYSLCFTKRLHNELTLPLRLSPTLRPGTAHLPRLQYIRLTAVQPEIERLNLQYVVMQQLFGNKVHFAPIKRPRKVLDIGTGTGIWCVEMGMAHAFKLGRFQALTSSSEEISRHDHNWHGHSRHLHPYPASQYQMGGTGR